jgi:myo-inositol-1(or 4)-monophosphatase
MHPYLNIAVKAARRAGKIITRYMEELDTLKIQEKGLNDLVTWVDQAAEQDIIETIHRAYPTHGILGEETGTHPGEDYVWIIDPLDGTMNYVHGFPHFAVSIGIQYKNQIEHAVIYDPLSQDLYTASRGRGAQLNGKRIRVSNRDELAGALIGSSFPYHNRAEFVDQHFNIFKNVFTVCADVRRTGSAALNLAYIASGRLDGFWESGLKPWDIAAGLLLVREAGGYITDYNGEHNSFENGTIIAGTRKVHGELLKIIQKG